MYVYKVLLLIVFGTCWFNHVMATRPLYIALNDCVSTLGFTPLDCGVKYLLKECEKMLGINELEGYRALTTSAEKVEFIASQCGVPLVEEEKEEK